MPPQTQSPNVVGNFNDSLQIENFYKMTRLLLLPFCLLTLTSCAQKPNDKEVYDKMVSEICSCSQTTQTQKASVLIDSCYKSSIKKNYETLQKLGIDSATQDGQNKLYNEVMANKFRLLCKDAYTRLIKEGEKYNASKLKFTGKFISQTPNYEKMFYVLILQSTQTKEQKEFHTTISIDESSRNDDITVEYEIVNNKQTNKDELIVKSVSSFGVRPVKQ